MSHKLNILVTGGAGYIGSMLVTDLVKLGHIVTVLDNLTYSKNSLSYGFDFIKFSLCFITHLRANLA